jgi:hypothetical protein
MAEARIDLPVIITPHNWEEVEQAFASLQRWSNAMSQQLNELRSLTTRDTVATTPYMTVGSFDYTSIGFFAQGASVWTVQDADVERFHYIRLGQLMFVQFQLVSTVISTDTSGSLFIRLYDQDVRPGRQLTASATGSPYAYPGGSLDWSDGQAGTIGGGNVGIVGQSYDTATRTILIQLDRFIGNSADASLYGEWPISNDLDIQGSLWWMTTPETVPQ